MSHGEYLQTGSRFDWVPLAIQIDVFSRAAGGGGGLSGGFGSL